MKQLEGICSLGEQREVVCSRRSIGFLKNHTRYILLIKELNNEFIIYQGRLRYDLTLSNNNVVKYRPFLIKEEKILLMAVESRDEAEMNNALINIVQSCTI